MFRMKLSKEYRVCYEGSRYRDRIDSLVGQLSMMGYPRMRICEMVRVWLRFAKYCDDASMRKRCSATSWSGFKQDASVVV
jgi:hypothetical protein